MTTKKLITLRRGFTVSIGKIGSLEVDFVAAKPNKIIYCHVSATILDKETRERELRPLRSIPDNYEKVILSMARTIYSGFKAIKNINILDFLIV